MESKFEEKKVNKMPSSKMDETRFESLERNVSFDISKIFENPFEPLKEKGPLQSIPGMAPIKGLETPDGWEREITECGLDRTACSVNFRPTDGSDTTLSFYDRGYPVVGSGAELFQQLIEKPSHVLNEDEIKQLTEQVIGVLADKSAFKITRAQTEDLNGKRVLTIDGDWSNGKKFHGYFIPAPDHRIREMYFEGDKQAFDTNFRSALDSINSIQWMPETN